MIIVSTLHILHTVWTLHSAHLFQHLCAHFYVCFRLVTMTTKRRLITDSFKVLKKARKGGKAEKSATPPPPQEGELIVVQQCYSGSSCCKEELIQLYSHCGGRSWILRCTVLLPGRWFCCFIFCSSIFRNTYIEHNEERLNSSTVIHMFHWSRWRMHPSSDNDQSAQSAPL